MSDAQKFSWRFVLEAQREAVVATVAAMAALPGGSAITRDIRNWEGSLALAARLYPLPKVTRPRVLTDEYGCEWKMMSWGVLWRGIGNEWGDKLARGDVSLTITTRRAQIIADLLANPTELVDDDGSTA